MWGWVGFNRGRKVRARRGRGRVEGGREMCAGWGGGRVE